MDPLVLTVLITAFGLIALILVTVVVAARADHQVTIRGPQATLEELDARISTKRETLVDLDEDLQKRREALANIADIQGEVDSLIRQKDELLAEHQQLDDRRAEVSSVRNEADEARSQLWQAASDLSDKKNELERVDKELAEARRLVGKLESMSELHRSLEAQISKLREEMADLDGLRRQEEQLRARLPEFEREAARLEGQIEACRGRLTEAEALEKTALNRVNELREKHAEAIAGLEAAKQQAHQLAAEIAERQDRATALEARAAQIEAQIEERKAQEVRGPDSAAKDPLAELGELPPVLKDLRRWVECQHETEEQALGHVRSHLEKIGLTYPRRVVFAFHTAMKVNETTQMAVLAGISGTGKSQLPRRYAEAMGIGFLQVPVQPRWDSPQDLMGFYNYIESRFRPTDMARALFHMDRWNGPSTSQDLQNRMLLVLLDEMNLARVEYYFSDFLSRLESRPGRERSAETTVRKDAELELDIPVPEGQTTPRIFPGYNVLFAGTMNEDESTQSLSDKVVDRANVLRFAAPRRLLPANEIAGTGTLGALSLRRWQGWTRSVTQLDKHRTRVEENISRIAGHMRDLQRPIGHRLGRAMMAYVANYPINRDGLDVRVPLADQIEMRLLPKLRGLDLDTLGGKLDEFCTYVKRDLDDDVLARAIDESVEASRNTGLFVWCGVSRE